MSAVSRHDGNKEDFIELFILTTETMSRVDLNKFWWECQNVEKP